MTHLISWQQHGQEHIGTPRQLLDELTYSNYAFNRQRSPHVTVAQWQRVYGEAVADLEARYQRQRSTSENPA